MGVYSNASLEMDSTLSSLTRDRLSATRAGRPTNKPPRPSVRLPLFSPTRSRPLAQIHLSAVDGKPDSGPVWVVCVYSFGSEAIEAVG